MREDRISRILYEMNREYLELYFSKGNSKFEQKNRDKIINKIKKLKRAIKSNNLRGVLKNSLYTIKNGHDFLVTPEFEELKNIYNERIEKSDLRIFSKKSCVVYTCITNEHDSIKEPLYYNPEIDYVLITDTEVSEDSVWKGRDINDIVEIQGLDPRMKARYIKTHPHIIFPQYEYSIYIDGSILIVTDLKPLLDDLDKNSFGVHMHPIRNCIYQEAEKLISTNKTNSRAILNQMKQYKYLGYPKENGLYETKILVRKHNDKDCINLMEKWWSELLTKSERDQLSLPYVLWESGIDISILGSDPNKNPRFRCFGHNVKNE